jgi:hypothetical protein
VRNWSGAILVTNGVADLAINERIHGGDAAATHRETFAGRGGFSKTLFINLIQHFGLETDVAKHLTESYGDRSWPVENGTVSNQATSTDTTDVGKGAELAGLELEHVDRLGGSRPKPPGDRLSVWTVDLRRW